MKKYLILFFIVSLVNAGFFGGGGGDDDSDSNLSFNAVDYVQNDCNASKDWNNSLTTKIINKEFNLSILAKDGDTETEANISKVQFYEYNNTDCNDGNVTLDICSGDGCGQTDSKGCWTLQNTKIDRAVKCIVVHIEGNKSSSGGGGGGGWF